LIYGICFLALEHTKTIVMPSNFSRLFWPAALLIFIFTSCGTEPEVDVDAKDISKQRAMEHAEMVKRGEYLVTAGGCNDCHSPKYFDAQGMHMDSTKLLSGSPAGMTLPPFNSSALTPGNWVQMSPDVTAFVGPWGISFAANLTPDSATGIGAWSEANFVSALRTGKHLGMASGRPILPPMPWFNFAKLTDEDLSSVYAYLKSIPSISNKVKEPVIPDEAFKMASLK
jgi:mono/diheme cytochrome c family protein